MYEYKIANLPKLLISSLISFPGKFSLHDYTGFLLENPSLKFDSLSVILGVSESPECQNFRPWFMLTCLIWQGYLRKGQALLPDDARKCFLEGLKAGNHDDEHKVELIKECLVMVPYIRKNIRNIFCIYAQFTCTLTFNITSCHR